MQAQDKALPAMGRARIALWLGLSVLVVLLDYYTGPQVDFPLLFVAPIALIAWHEVKWWAIATSVILPFLRAFYEYELWPVHASAFHIVLNGFISCSVLIGFAVLTARVSSTTRALRRQVKILRGMLPVCSFCKSIRDREGNWYPLERYITQHSEAEFTHTFCPSCMAEHYGDVLKQP